MIFIQSFILLITYLEEKCIEVNISIKALKYLKSAIFISDLSWVRWKDALKKYGLERGVYRENGGFDL